MSTSAQVDGPTTVSGVGVAVTKEFADDEDLPIPTIGFVVKTERDESVPLTPIENVPAQFPVDDIEDDVETVASDVEDFDEWRDELGEMFQ